ncbi:MAG TPA: hypothetical protein VNA25_03740 [Phycisphaerae bacterium]|nr:hypothetical protein [Phycisphaerae bacterium]HUT56971.1 hypothetical protein [Phycisphaerae bacterium]
MLRSVLSIAVGSALYGFAAGSSHSLRLASWNLLKFPLLVFMTAGLCALAYYAMGKLFTRLSFRHSLALALGAFADTSILLASLSPVVLFLGQAIDRPDGRGLNEYPLFLGLNVVFIATSGTVALVRQARSLLKVHRLAVARSVGIVLAWLAVSLFVGGQCAWFLRPFYGVCRTEPVVDRVPSDYRGAGNFYEAVWNLLDPPSLPGECRRHK